MRAEVDIVSELRSYIDLTTESPPRRPRPTLTRNPPLDPTEVCVQTITFRGHVFKENQVISIKPTTEERLRLFSSQYSQPNHKIPGLRASHSQLPLISFLLVKKFIRGPSGIAIRGIPFSNLRDVQAVFGQGNAELNEICPVYEIDEDDPREPEEQAVVTIPLDIVFSPRKVVYTNAAPPDFVFHWEQNISQDLATRAGVLVVRWRYEILFRSAVHREKGQRAGENFVRLSSIDVKNPEFRVDPEVLRARWRGVKTIKGGSYLPREAIRPNLDLLHRLPGQKYTVADMFCGAGGCSRGAEMAGFKIALGVDMDEHACASYAANFPNTRLFPTTVEDFLRETKGEIIRTDVLHLSPPCQYWSPAHTVAGPNDEANVAAMFACENIIRRIRPRFITLEQTFGIKNFHDYFATLKRFFIKHGYSLRWQIKFLSSYGLPQRRQRLLMIAAGPGEILPPWPMPSHGSGPSCKPLTTIRQALKRVVLEEPFMHVPAKMKKLNKPRLPSDCILAKCITTGGGHNHHHSGERNYSLREYACLQGFPLNHVFRGNRIKRQIGNAFPPCVVRTIYEHLEREMLKSDGLLPAQTPVIDLVEAIEEVHIDVEEEACEGEQIVVALEVEVVVVEIVASDSDSSRNPSSVEIIDLD